MTGWKGSLLHWLAEQHKVTFHIDDIRIKPDS